MQAYRHGRRRAGTVRQLAQGRAHYRLSCQIRYGYESRWYGLDAIRQRVSTVANWFLLALKRERKVRIPKRHRLSLIANMTRLSRSTHSALCCLLHITSAASPEDFARLGVCHNDKLNATGASEAEHNTNKWSGIITSTAGLIFFGTPFRGAKGMSQSGILEAVLSTSQSKYRRRCCGF